MLSFGLILNPQPNRSWNDHTESITQTPWCNAVAPVTSFAIMFEPYADNRRRVETLLSAAAYYMESSRPDRAPQHSIFFLSDKKSSRANKLAAVGWLLWLNLGLLAHVRTSSLDQLRLVM